MHRLCHACRQNVNGCCHLTLHRGVCYLFCHWTETSLRQILSIVSQLTPSKPCQRAMCMDLFHVIHTRHLAYQGPPNGYHACHHLQHWESVYQAFGSSELYQLNVQPKGMKSVAIITRRIAAANLDSRATLTSRETLANANFLNTNVIPDP